MRRLTQAQYENAVHALLGDEVVLHRALNPMRWPMVCWRWCLFDNHFPRGGAVRRQPSLAIQAMENEAVRDALVPCEADGVQDDVCGFGALAAERACDVRSRTKSWTPL